MKYQDADEIAKVYNQHGQAYHQSRKSGHGRLFNELLDMPTTLSLLPERLDGYTLLDAGCGSGIYGQQLARRRAQVTGIDISKEMIEIAKKETPPDLKITYQVGNLYELPYKDSTFDFIICAYVLENIEDIARVFKEFYRVLKDEGKCIFSISHPLRALSEKVNRDGKEAWLITNYFDRSMRKSDFGSGMIVLKYKRPLEDYVKAFKNAGFLMEDLREPIPVKEGREVDPINYEKARRLPQLLTMKLVK